MLKHKHIRLFIILIILFFCSLNLFSQSKYNSKTVDSETYYLYIDKKWKPLISEGKEALKNNIDFFYLRMRLGIAYYEQGKYIKAAEHFNKAYNFNQYDTLCNEYLYYSNLFSGRKKQAGLFVDRISRERKNKLGIKKYLFINANLSSTYIFNQDFENIKKNNIGGIDKIFGEQLIFQNLDLYNISYGLNLSKRISFYNSVCKLHINKTKQILYESDLYEFKNDVDEYQIYFRLNYLFNNDFKINAAINTIFTKQTLTSLQEIKTLVNVPFKFVDNITHQIVNDTIYNFPEFSYDFFDFYKNTWSWVGFIGLSKSFSIFDINLFSTYSNINNGRQFQLGGSLKVYPLGNTNLYLSGEFIYQSEFGDEKLETENTGYLFKNNIGFRALNIGWIYATYAFGEIRNFNSNFAMDIFDSGDMIKQKAEIGIQFPINLNLNLFLQYSYSLNEQKYLTYKFDKQVTNEYETYYNNLHDLGKISITTDEYKPVLKNINFNNHIITGGLTWNF